jgi:hypothetical protein
MAKEYSKLQSLYLNSDKRKRELELKTKLHTTQTELEGLREHLSGLYRRNQGNKVSVRREHEPQERLEV